MSQIGGGAGTKEREATVDFRNPIPMNDAIARADIASHLRRWTVLVGITTLIVLEMLTFGFTL